MNIKRYAKEYIKKKLGIEISRIKPTIVNPCVNLKKKTIFIAVPKTGSTSVVSQIRQKGSALNNNTHLDINQMRVLIYVYLLQERLKKNYSFPAAPAPPPQIRGFGNKHKLFLMTVLNFLL